VVLGAGAAAAEEADNQDDDADDDEGDGRVDVGRVHKVDVIAHHHLTVGPERDEGHSGEEEKEVEDEGQILQRRVATVLHPVQSLVAFGAVRRSLRRNADLGEALEIEENGQ